MSNQRSQIAQVLVILLIIVVLVGLTWANHQFVRQNPGGNDFLPRWVGTRMFLMRGWSPYSEQTNEAIQEMIFGRAAELDEDQSLFVYPMYTILIMAPYGIIQDYELARALWMTTLEISLVLLALSGISLSRWKPPVWLFIATILFSLFWYHSLRAVINGNASILIALFIAVSLLLLRQQQDALAGVLLALTTIKPQMVVLLIPLVFLWAISQRRWTIIGVFFGSLAIMAAIGMLFHPSWPMQNLAQVLTYPGYTLPGTPGAILTEWLPGVGKQLGWMITALMVGVLVVEWRATWKKEFVWLLWTAYLTLTITNLIGIRTATANYVALLPGLLLVFAAWDERWPRMGRWLSVITMGILFFGLWFIFLRTIQMGDQPVQSPIMFFPFPVILLVLLYWVRWWATKPPRLYLDRLRSAQKGAR